LVAGVFQRAAAGESYVRLRRFLLDNGVTMSVQSIRRLLTNRVYLGEMHWGSSANAQRGSRTLVHEPIQNLHAHEPIVDEITFRRAQRAGRKFGLGREKHDPRLLAGLARCAGCRSTMVVNRMSGREPYYTCRQASLAPDQCAGSASIVAGLLEKHVNTRFVAWLRDEWPNKAQDDRGHQLLRELDAEIAEAEAQILDFNRREVQTMLGTGWLDGLRDRYAHAEQLSRQREVLLADLNLPEALVGITEPEDYLRLDLDEQRRALASVIDIVFVRQTSRRGPAASTDAAIAERVEIVFRPDGDEIDPPLPRPGVKTDWQPWVFRDQPKPSARVAKGKARKPPRAE
jgi:hypothetical protein